MEQGRALGQLAAVGLIDGQAASRDFWIQETLATAAIEGQKLDLDAVRSSVCRRLGLAASDGPHDRDVEGLVEMMQDAITGHDRPLDEDRLCRWQSALFPGGTVGVRRIAVGRYRDHADPMQIVSGPPGREVVHYAAPPSAEVAAEMQQLLAWLALTPNTPAAEGINGIARAALAHLWFESIHPFEDGNGRLGRAVAEMALAQDLGRDIRWFSLSAVLLERRADYYTALNQAQRGGLDVTPWVRWFTQAFAAACVKAQAAITQATRRAEFRLRAAHYGGNDRQRKVLARLLEAGDGGFLGGLTADRYAKLTAVSKATATRDLADLLQAGLLVVQGVGKATRYAVNVAGWNRGV